MQLPRELPYLSAVLLMGARHHPEPPQVIGHLVHYRAALALVTFVVSALATFQCRLQGAEIKDGRAVPAARLVVPASLFCL
ncbi:MAG TPA: hypothetical protein VF171_01180 [Trueperaceae bacterium]